MGRSSNHCELSQEAIEWINGELLGDGHLRPHSVSSQFTYSSKHLEYIQYISDTLSSFGIKQCGRIRKIYLRKSNSYSHRYSSLRYVELSSTQKKWYPEGKKIIPRDIRFTPLTLRQWYIGDGYLRSSGERSRIFLYTNGFTVLDVEWLIKQLIKLEFKSTRTNQNVIHVSRYSTKEFLNYIGNCPVECYKYKWNYQDNRKEKCVEVSS